MADVHCEVDRRTRRTYKRQTRYVSGFNGLCCIAVVEDAVVVVGLTLDWRWVECALSCSCIFMGSRVLPRYVHSLFVSLSALFETELTLSGALENEL